MNVTTTIEHVVDIDAAPAVIYEMWTTSDGLSAWWGVTATADPRPGGMIRVDIDGEHVMLGEFVSLERPNRVVFTFGWEHGDLPPGATTVDVAIEATAGGWSRLTLRHSGLPTRLLESHAAGWNHFLDEQLAQIGATA